MRQEDPKPEVRGSLGFFARRNRGGADFAEASLSTRLDDPAPGVAAEADPLAEFKKSPAYKRLIQLGVINTECKLVNPYFRAEHVDENGDYEFNAVYKVHTPFNSYKVFLSVRVGKGDEQSNRGWNDGTLWTDSYFTLRRSNEAEYLASGTSGN